MFSSYRKKTNCKRTFDMASASSLLSEDQFQCSVCLDVFTEPVSIPCGHTFCKTCITKCWDNSDLCQCPLCAKTFCSRPDAHINIVLSEMVAQFRKSVQERSSSIPDQQAARPGEVSCDICTGEKIKAIKSCLECQTSYCEIHLQPHHIRLALKKHQLIHPVENLEDRVCKKHDRPLQLFCRTDRACVCQFCTETDHKTHETVPLQTECKERKDEMKTKEAEVQQMIQERQQKIQQIKRSVDLSDKGAEQDMAECADVFTALVASIKRCQAELFELIKEKQKAAEKKAEGFIKELEQEIAELKKRRTELEELSLTEDHLHLLHSFPSLSAPPPTRDWSEVSVHWDVSVETVRRAVVQLEETLSEDMEKLLEVKLKRIQQYAVDVTLDPDTAQPSLILSDDGKQVKHGGQRKDLPDNPERFNKVVNVLGKQSFSSGRFYYEVQVKEKTEWDLGLVRESINRKGVINLDPADGYWVIWLSKGDQYEAIDNPSVSLSLKEKPQVIGVFVDYEEGRVSFYDVETRAHIYSFTGCSFTEKLYPYFSPSLNDGGTNAAPLIICPLKQQH